MKIKETLNQENPYYFTEKDPKKFAEIYNKKYSTLYYRKKIQEIFRLIKFPLKNKKVLDIGCCGGHISLKLAKKGAMVTGIDLSKYAINAAKYNKRKYNIKKNCKFIKKDFNKLETNEKFDLIIAKDVIEHIENDVGFLKKIESMLEKNGKLIITTQNSFSFNYIFEGIIRKILGQKKWLGWDSTHIRWYNPWKLKRKFEEANLKVSGYSSSYFFPYEMKKFISKKRPKSRAYTLIDDLLGDVLPFSLSGWSISVIGKKP